MRFRYPSYLFPFSFYLVFPFIIGLYSCNGKIKEKEKPLFGQVSASHSGLNFINEVHDKEEITIYDNVYVYNGAGTATGDINNDGLPDIFLVSNQGQSRLFLNRGDFKFEDVTENSGIEDAGGWSTGVTFADVNADGWLDIYLCKAGFQATEKRVNLLFLNQKDGTFREAAEEMGLNSSATSTHATFFDYDLDGDLDCYLVNHPENFDLIMDFYYYIYNPEVDTLNMNRLYENRDGKFVDVSLQSGIGYEKGFGLSVRVTDANLDGYPDIFVANDFLTPDYYYQNNGDGTFSEKMQEKFDKVSLFSMGSDFGDVNNDGLPDLLVVDMEPADHYRRKCNDITFPIEFYEQQTEFFKGEQFSRNMLHLGRGDGSFSEVGEWAGLAKTDWSWNVILEDLDNDGWQDAFITNGTKRELNERDYMSLAFGEEKLGEAKTRHNADELIDSLPVTLLKNQAFRNRGNGRFISAEGKWGLNQALTSSGAAFADFDLDGDLDLVVNNSDTLASLYQNLSNERGNHFLQIKLQGEPSNSFGIGTKIFAFSGEKQWFRELACSRGFQSSSQSILHLGLGDITELDRLRIEWPGGKIQTLNGVKVDQILELKYSEAKEITDSNHEGHNKPIFIMVKAPDFGHQENNFNDFKRDKIIPQMLSREGPPLTVADVNGDGHKDFFFGGAAGQSGILFLGNENGEYTSSPGPWEEDKQFEDLGICFFDANGDGNPDLYVASGSNEFYPGAPELNDRLYLNTGEGQFIRAENALPESKEATCSPVAIDFDRDGDEDLFIAGRMVPGEYGKPGQSRLLRNEQGKFTDVSETVAPGLANSGMITSALWADMNGDSWPDLVLTGQWMAPQIWLNQKGNLQLSKENGLAKYSGWWSALAAVDLDGDGDIDLAAGNFGFNSIFKASQKEPLELWAGDFDESGSWDPVLLHYLRGEQGTFVDRELFCKSMPDFFNDFHTHKSFAEKAPENLFSPERLKEAIKLKAKEMGSGWFENDGKGNFIFHLFPAEVQQAPIRVILSSDFDGDGKTDLFLAGNSSAHFYDLGKIMASRGHLLVQSQEGFRAVPMKKSGLNLKGEIASGKLFVGKNDQLKIILGRNSGQPLMLDLRPKNEGGE